MGGKDKMKTDSEYKKDIAAIEKLLGVKAEERHSSNCATFRLNGEQELFIRLSGYRGKGFAQVLPLTEFRRCGIQASYSIEKAHISINFAEDKAPDAIVKDVTRRLLNAPAASEAQKYIKEVMERHLKHEGDLYITLQVNGDYVTVDRISLGKGKHLECIKALIEIHKGKK